MTTASVGMCKDEADIAEAHVRWMARQVDFLIVADNGSTDGTREILDGLSRELPLTVIDDPEVGYYQSAKVSGLARLAMDMGAGWVVPADFDEVWYSPFGRITDVLGGIPAEWLVASAALYDHVPTGLDPDAADPIERIVHRKPDPAPLPKVAARTASDLVIEQGAHGAHFSFRAAYLEGQLVVRHFPYRSPEQFVRKAVNGAAAYAATDLPAEAGAHWRQYGRLIAEGGDQVGYDIFRKWFWRPDAGLIVVDGERLPGLLFDPVSSAVDDSLHV